MNADKLRQALLAFLGPERFRRFVEHLRKAGRLRIWQEEVWATFTTQHPEFDVAFAELQVALRICELHGCELEFGSVGVFHGNRDHTNRYLRLRNQMFPHAALEPASTEGTPFDENQVPVSYCPDCRSAEAVWKEGLESMVTIDDLLFRKEPFPVVGIAVDDLLHALQVLAEAQEVSNKQVMGFRLFSDGHLLVTTGELLGGCAGGGEKILLRKENQNWVLAEVAVWRS